MAIKLAGCIIPNEAGQILLVHRNTKEWQQWEVPGGKTEESESPEDTALREVEEEIGLRVKIIRKLAAKVFTEKNYELHYTWFLARIISGEIKIMETDKFDDVRYISLAEMRTVPLSTGAQTFINLVDSGEITL